MTTYVHVLFSTNCVTTIITHVFITITTERACHANSYLPPRIASYRLAGAPCRRLIKTTVDRLQISEEEAERVQEGLVGAIMESVRESFTKSLTKMGAVNPRIPLPQSGASILNPGKIFNQIMKEAIMATGRQHIMESDSAYRERLAAETRRRMRNLPQRHREFMSPKYFL